MSLVLSFNYQVVRQGVSYVLWTALTFQKKPGPCHHVKQIILMHYNVDEEKQLDQDCGMWLTIDPNYPLWDIGISLCMYFWVTLLLYII